VIFTDELTLRPLDWPDWCNHACEEEKFGDGEGVVLARIRAARMSARILIIDDYATARKTIRFLLVWQSMDVCGEAENGRQAVEKVKLSS
jgi:hypothetical protein